MNIFGLGQGPVASSFKQSDELSGSIRDGWYFD